jgi:hypothetical protein
MISFMASLAVGLLGRRLPRWVKTVDAQLVAKKKGRFRASGELSKKPVRLSHQEA